jgi:hypothetical protein
MLKITTHVAEDATRITLEGRLAGPWIHELERCWRESEHAAAGRRVIVDLTGVTFVEQLSVPCIFEGRSELRNAGRVNCKIHWPILGCGTPYLLNVFDTLQFSFWKLQCAWLSVHAKLQISHIYVMPNPQKIRKMNSSMSSV